MILSYEIHLLNCYTRYTYLIVTFLDKILENMSSINNIIIKKIFFSTNP